MEIILATIGAVVLAFLLVAMLDRMGISAHSRHPLPSTSINRKDPAHGDDQEDPH